MIMGKIISSLAVVLTVIQISNSIRIEVNDKDLPNNFYQEEDFNRRKLPISSSGCDFKKKKPVKVYKTDGSGRTFVDLVFVHTEYNYEYNVNCGSPGGNHGIRPPHKPILGGHHKPGFAGNNKPLNHNQNSELDSGTGDHIGNRPHKPFLAMLIGHRPFQNLFGHADASSETTSENGPESSRPGIFNNIISSFTNILPSPQDVGQGLGNGIASFIQTIPQIGQSFQSLLPDLNNFQLPFFGGSTAQNFPNPITNVNNGLPSDEFKPVNENHDPVTDPYKNRFQHGYYRNYEQSLNGDSYKKENINEERSLNPQSANVQQKVHVNRIRFPS